MRNLSQILPEESPLAFVRRNLRSVTESPETINQAVEEIIQDKTPAPEAPATSQQHPQQPQSPPETPSESTDPLDALELDDPAPVEEPKDDVAPEEKPKLTLQDNFKQLRKNHKETINQLKAIEEEKASLQKKLEDINTGNAVPEIVQKYEDRIQELTYFQKLHDFKASDEYQELHRPIEEATNRLVTLGKEYEIPENVITQALNISSKRELNEFLSENFDPVGALEAKNLIESISQGQQKIKEAEKTPAEALAQLREQQQYVRAQKDMERKSSIKARAESAWRDALMEIRKTNKVRELIPSADNSEHNKNVVNPLLTAAGAEYGKIIKTLAEKGLTELTPELATAIANSVLYGHASAVSINQREEAVNYATELHDTLKRDARFNRPGIGSSGKPSSVAAPQSSEPMTPAKAAQSITQKILNNRR